MARLEKRHADALRVIAGHLGYAPLLAEEVEEIAAAIESALDAEPVEGEESVDTITVPPNPDKGQNSDTYPELSPDSATEAQNSDTSPKHDTEGDTSATS